MIGTHGGANSARQRAAPSSTSPSTPNLVEEGVPWGTESGGTAHLNSPSTPTASRLVARRLRRGHAERRVSTSCAAASTRCSQLSKIRSILLSRKTSKSVSESGSWGRSDTPRASATVLATSSPYEIGARSTSHTPSG
jgi:hypothetical protein